jgi:hypothetical protein
VTAGSRGDGDTSAPLAASLLILTAATFGMGRPVAMTTTSQYGALGAEGMPGAVEGREDGGTSPLGGTDGAGPEVRADEH